MSVPPTQPIKLVRLKQNSLYNCRFLTNDNDKTFCKIANLTQKILIQDFFCINDKCGLVKNQSSF